MKTKRDKARDFILIGDKKNALKLCRQFDLVYSNEELRYIKIAYECLTGRESFYKSIGIDTDKTKILAFNLLNRMINKLPYSNDTHSL